MSPSNCDLQNRKVPTQDAASVRANHIAAKLLAAAFFERPTKAQIHEAPKTTSEMAVDFDGKRGIA